MITRPGDRFRHPLRTRRVEEVCRVDDPAAVGRAVQTRDLRRADPVVRWAARGIAHDVRVHGAAGDRLRALEADVDDLDDRVHLTGHRPGRAPRRILVRGASGRPVTAAEAASECTRHARTIDDATALDHHRTVRRTARVVGVLLLGVDVVALFLVFARVVDLDWASPDPARLVAATVFSVVGAGATTRLALLLGEHLWVWRRSGPRGVDDAPARSATAAALGAALAVLSLATGAAILLRIVAEAEPLDLGALGVVLGILVGAAAAAAPWLVVVASAHDGTEHTRALAAHAAVVAWTDRRRRRLGAAQDRARATRRRCRERAQVRLCRAELAVARRHRRYDEVLLLAAASGPVPLAVATEGPRLVPGPHDELAPLRALADRMQREAVVRRPR